MSLSDYATAELQAELRRRKGREPIPETTWHCHRCGAVGQFSGPWKPWLYQLQALAFRDAHRHCQSLYGGGGI